MSDAVYVGRSGLSEVIALMNSFSFSPSDVAYLRTVLPHCEEEFFAWLGQLDCRDVRLYALEEGSLCFPRVPLIRVEVGDEIVIRLVKIRRFKKVRGDSAAGSFWCASTRGCPLHTARRNLYCVRLSALFVFFCNCWIMPNLAACSCPREQKIGLQLDGGRPDCFIRCSTSRIPCRLACMLCFVCFRLYASCLLFAVSNCDGFETIKGPARGGAAFGNAIAESHQLSIAHSHERGEATTGGRGGQDAAGIRPSSGTGVCRDEEEDVRVKLFGPRHLRTPL